eukprot:142032_1
MNDTTLSTLQPVIMHDNIDNINDNDIDTEIEICDKCGITKDSLKTKGTWSRHLHSKHTYYCKQCPAQFTTAIILQEHEKQNHKNNLFIYKPSAQKIIKKMSDESNKIFKDGLPDKCLKCGRYRGDTAKSHWNKHINTDHRYPCPHCEYKFAHRKKYNEHLESTHCVMRGKGSIGNDDDSDGSSNGNRKYKKKYKKKMKRNSLIMKHSVTNETPEPSPATTPLPPNNKNNSHNHKKCVSNLINYAPSSIKSKYFIPRNFTETIIPLRIREKINVEKKENILNKNDLNVDKMDEIFEMDKIPNNFIEFEKMWNRAKINKNRALILLKLKNKRLDKIIKNMMDDKLFSQIIQCVHYIGMNNDICDTLVILKQLIKLDRFEMIVMFMDENDEKLLKEVKQKCVKQKLNVAVFDKFE